MTQGKQTVVERVGVKTEAAGVTDMGAAASTVAWMRGAGNAWQFAGN